MIRINYSKSVQTNVAHCLEESLECQLQKNNLTQSTSFKILILICPMSIIQIATPFNIDLEFEIAEFHKRLFAYIIDFFVLVIYLMIMKNLYYGGFNRVSASIMESHIGIDILSISVPT